MNIRSVRDLSKNENKKLREELLSIIKKYNLIGKSSIGKFILFINQGGMKDIDQINISK